MNQTEWERCLVRLNGAYHGQTTSEQQRKELYRVLGHFSEKQVQRAIDHCVEQHDYYPKPSQLLGLIDKGPRLSGAPCGACDGTGWRDVEPPELDAEGNAAAKGHVEQPWVVKCKVCGGSGKGQP